MIVDKRKAGSVTEITGKQQAHDFIPYLVADAFVLQRTDLTATDKLVHTTINSFNHNQKPFFGSNQFIADSLGISPRTVRRSLEKLESMGLLKRDLQYENNALTRKSISTLPPDRDDLPPGHVDPTPRTEMTTDNQVYNQSILLSKDNRASSKKRTDIDEVIGYLETKLGSPLDGTIKGNRYAAKTWLDNRIPKAVPGHKPVTVARSVIDAAFETDFHAKNATRIKYLSDNMQKIVRDYKGRGGSAKIYKLGE